MWPASIPTKSPTLVEAPGVDLGIDFMVDAKRRVLVVVKLLAVRIVGLTGLGFRV